MIPPKSGFHDSLTGQSQQIPEPILSIGLAATASHEIIFRGSVAHSEGGRKRHCRGTTPRSLTNTHRLPDRRAWRRSLFYRRRRSTPPSGDIRWSSMAVGSGHLGELTCDDSWRWSWGLNAGSILGTPSHFARFLRIVRRVSICHEWTTLGDGRWMSRCGGELLRSHHRYP